MRGPCHFKHLIAQSIHRQRCKNIFDKNDLLYSFWMANGISYPLCQSLSIKYEESYMSHFLLRAGKYSSAILLSYFIGIGTTNAFSWMKIFAFRLKFHCNLFQLTINQHWFRSETTVHCSSLSTDDGLVPIAGDKPSSEPMMAYFNDPYMRHSVDWWQHKTSAITWFIMIR